MSKINDMINNLSQPQRNAIALVKLSLDCFNSAEGSGMFTGVTRYNSLAQRMPLAAIQARDIHGFWSGLLRKMQWGVPPKSMDARIIECLDIADQWETLKVLATEAVSIITLARALHDQDKKERKKDSDTEFLNHSLEDIL